MQNNSDEIEAKTISHTTMMVIRERIRSIYKECISTKEKTDQTSLHQLKEIENKIDAMVKGFGKLLTNYPDKFKDEEKKVRNA